MASLGDLVVNLTANTTQFQKGMSNAQQTVNRMAAATMAMGAVAVQRLASTGDMFHKMALRTGIAAEELSRFKFAAEQSGSSLPAVEKSLKTMSVLLLNAERGMATATDAMSELGISSEDVADQSMTQRFQIFAEAIAGIEDPGRRAAMAVQVFGRSGMDLLPLILEGAEGFKKLAAESDALGNTVSTTEAQMGADLTDAFNRVKVAGDGLFRTIGMQLGPSIVAMANAIAKGFAVAQQYSKEIVIVGSAVIVAATAMKAVTLATMAYTKAKALALSLSGPKGWAVLAGSLAVAAGATYVLSGKMDELNAELAAANPAAAAAASAMDDIGNNAANSAAGVDKLSQATNHLQSMLQTIETPAERVARTVAEFQAALAASGKGIVWDGHPLVQAMLEHESGFTSAMQTIQDELAILSGAATQTGLDLQRMLDAGVDPAQVEKLRELYDEREKLRTQQEAKDQWAQRAADQARQVEAIMAALETPEDKIRAETKRVSQLVSAGLLTQESADAFIAKLTKSLMPEKVPNVPNMNELYTPKKTQEPKFAGAMQQGSEAAMSTILKAMGQPFGKRSPEVAATEKVVVAIKDLPKHLKRQRERDLKLQGRV